MQDKDQLKNLLFLQLIRMSDSARKIVDTYNPEKLFHTHGLHWSARVAIECSRINVATDLLTIKAV